MLTLKDVLRGRSTLQQYEILQRADRLLADRCGRHFCGPLLPTEVHALVDGVDGRKG